VSRSEAEVPTLKAVQAALCHTSETLARELAHPSEIAPQWSQFEWRVARAVAVLHGVSGVLLRRLRWPAPADWIGFLAAQHSHMHQRYARIRALLQAIDGRAQDQGVGFVALKGAALHELGLYAAGERPMADLDLLVGAADVERMAAVLEGMRFRETTVTWKHRVFEGHEVPPPAAFGEHTDNGIKIDLHVRIRELLPRRPIDVQALILPSQPHPGLNPYPSLAALMAHLLLHAAGSITQRTLRLVQLHDLALLSAHMSADDWAELAGPIARDRGLWWALAPLLLLSRYYGPVPPPVVATAAHGCRWPLRRSGRQRLLWEVSFSDLRRVAFPGIEWSQSAGDALAYAMQRATLAARVVSRTLVTGSVTGGLDGIVTSALPGLPARGWLALRPIRPATLHAVRTALAQAR
jgi:Uncharacterised nucleotidyltransferase